MLVPVTHTGARMDTSYILLLLLLQRFFELRHSARNGRSLRARGAIEIAPRSYRLMVSLHLMFFISLAIESWPWHTPLDNLHMALLGALLVVQALRYWSIISLGEFWNTRILILPGSPVIRSGPYRFLKHPNYLVIVLEFALLPALLGSPLTLIVFSLANLAVLRQRIGLEESGLRNLTDYERFFASPSLERK